MLKDESMFKRAKVNDSTSKAQNFYSILPLQNNCHFFFAE